MARSTSKSAKGKGDSTLANLCGVTSDIHERVEERFGRMDRPQRSRWGWRIPLGPQMAANHREGVDKVGFGFAIPGRLPGWQVLGMQGVCHEDHQAEQP
jgi:hypothetical protein